MKYIRFERHPESSPTFILFVAPVLHVEVAEMMSAAGLKPASAGFYDPAAEKCFGESSTLKLKPAEADSKILAAMVRATLATAPDKPKPAYSDEVKRFAAGEPRDHRAMTQAEAGVRRREVTIPPGTVESVLREIAGLE